MRRAKRAWRFAERRWDRTAAMREVQDKLCSVIVQQRDQLEQGFRASKRRRLELQRADMARLGRQCAEIGRSASSHVALQLPDIANADLICRPLAANGCSYEWHPRAMQGMWTRHTGVWRLASACARATGRGSAPSATVCAGRSEAS